MKRREFLKKGLEGIVVGILVIGATKTFGDGGFVSGHYYLGKIFQGEQMAVIKYEEGVEDVIFKVKYEGEADEFGWIIPVPAQPEVDTKSEEFDKIFKELATLTQSSRIGWTMKGRGENSEGYWSDAHVYVVEETTVGIYNVAVIQAYKSNALTNWLNQHGYFIPIGGENIINEYVNKNWYFVAAKIIPEQFEEKGNIHPIRLTFKTSEIIYPMKITSISAKENMDVLLYIFTGRWYRGVGLMNDSESEIITVSYRNIYKKDISGYPAISKFLNKDYYSLTKLGLRYHSPSDMSEDIVLNKITTTIPEKYLILESYPNPFNVITYIEYNLPRDSYVELKVYNILGQEIETLINLYQRAGRYKTVFSGQNLPSGVYICRLRTQDFIKAKKITLLK